MKKSVLAAVLLLSAILVVPLAPSAADERGGVTCRGLAATHVGVPGEDLTTTSGPDVVVTNGARNVLTLAGDDTICVTRARLVDVTPGRGNDLIDTSGYQGVKVDADLGSPGAEGSSGDDTYIGGDHWDEIAVSSGASGDHKQIDTGDHQDYLYVHSGYRGTMAATLGADDDSYFIARPRAAVDVDGGAGTADDDFYTLCSRCDTATFDVGAGPIEVDGVPAGSASGFEYVRVFHQPRHMTRQVTAIGSDGLDNIDIAACHTEIRGAGGNDWLYAFPVPELCDGFASEISGDEGDDAIYGTDGRDVLRGGAGDDTLFGRRARDDLGGWLGRDRADGGDGRDRCRAEVRLNCER